MLVRLTGWLCDCCLFSFLKIGVTLAHLRSFRTALSEIDCLNITEMGPAILRPSSFNSLGPRLSTPVDLSVSKLFRQSAVTCSHIHVYIICTIFVFICILLCCTGPPSVEVFPGASVTVDINGSLSLDCRASGRPEPTVTWTLSVSPVSFICFFCYDASFAAFLTSVFSVVVVVNAWEAMDQSVLTRCFCRCLLAEFVSWKINSKSYHWIFMKSRK